MLESYELIIETILWYNGLFEIVNTWADLPEKDGIIRIPEHYNEPEPICKENQAQLVIIWMMAVLLFGDYGTSPRVGWIEHIDEFKKWVHRITDECIQRATEEDQS